MWLGGICAETHESGVFGNLHGCQLKVAGSQPVLGHISEATADVGGWLLRLCGR